MTRVQARKAINEALRITTAGLHSDDCWEPVYNAWKAIRALGFEIEHTGSRYDQDFKGNPISKIWTYQIPFGTKKPFYGVLTCHGAGSVDEPLSKYDISAYVS